MEIQISPEKQKEIIKFFNSPETQKKIASSLPETVKKMGMTPQRMIRLLFNSIQTTPELATCNLPSILQSLIQCAIIGLEPNTPLGLAWILPYRGKAQFVLGYRGLLELCYRSKQGIYPMAYAVYEGDDFSFQYGTGKFLHHTPKGNINDDALTHVYAITKIQNDYEFLVMFRSEVDYIRSLSPASNSEYSPWKKFYAQMAMKTVLKRFLKNLPLSTEIGYALYYDENENAEIIESNFSILDVENQKREKKEKAGNENKEEKNQKNTKREILLQRLLKIPQEQLEQAKQKLKIQKETSKLTIAEMEAIEKMIINQL